MTRTLTWLHLSDFHARKRDNWDAHQITETLVQELKTMQKAHGLRPDFIFFTGDLAYGAVSGENMADQYQLVRNFLGDFQKLIYPLGGSNQDVPFGQDWVAFAARQESSSPQKR